MNAFLSRFLSTNMSVHQSKCLYISERLYVCAYLSEFVYNHHVHLNPNFRKRVSSWRSRKRQLDTSLFLENLNLPETSDRQLHKFLKILPHRFLTIKFSQSRPANENIFLSKCLSIKESAYQSVYLYKCLSFFVSNIKNVYLSVYL